MLIPLPPSNRYHITNGDKLIAAFTQESQSYSKPIPGYEDYLISIGGAVYSLKSKKYLKLCPMKAGYLMFSTSTAGTIKTHLLHRALAQTFIPNPDNLPQVDHIDRNTGNNTLRNLRWVTPTKNQYNRTQKKNGSSKYMGVYWRSNVHGWVARIVVDGVSKFLGSYDNEEDAGEAYQKAKAELHRI